MSYFPMFIDLNGKHCVIVGGGAVALRKAKALLSFGAKVFVVAPVILEELNHSNVTFRTREFLEDDINDAFLVIAATNDEDLNQQIVRLCKERSVFVNSATTKENGTFLFPGLVKKKDITIGVSTAGKSPAVTKRICEDITKQIPDSYAEILDQLEEARNEVKLRVKEQKRRKEILHKLIGIAMEGEPLTMERIDGVIKEYE